MQRIIMRVLLKYFLICLGVFLLLSAEALAQPQFPEDFPSEFTQFEGCEVVNVMNMQNNITAMLKCGQNPMKKVYDFYVGQAKTAEWKILMQNQAADAMMCIAEKNQKTFQFVVAKEGQETQVALTLISKTK